MNRRLCESLHSILVSMIRRKRNDDSTCGLSDGRDALSCLSSFASIPDFSSFAGNQRFRLSSAYLRRKDAVHALIMNLVQ